MSGVADALQTEFPEATKAECIRFSNAVQDGTKEADKVKEEAEQLLENYLDWRSCYGLDYYKKNNNKKQGEASADENGETINDDDDAADWDYAIQKALEVEASMRKAKELEKKLAEEEANKDEETKKFTANYDFDLSNDSKDSKEEGEGDDKTREGGYKDNVDEEDEAAANKKEETDAADDESAIINPKDLQQMVYLHKNKTYGNDIVDKNGTTILHVLPGMINRKVATGDIYGLAICFYLDRKFDRSSEQKMTVLIDVRAGEGWPNPVAFMMVRFVRKVVTMLQAHYPERLDTLHLYPVPRMAMSIFGGIKRVFKYNIMDKIVLYAGPADRYAPMPKTLLEQYVDGNTLDFLEEFRVDHFKPTITTVGQEMQ